MAEKEERIRVLVAKNPCKECSIKKCTRKCMFGILFEKAPGITRAEAIRKMCEGWDKLREQINADKEHAHCCSNKMIMEAALNALLEGEKIK